jgi:hypothetical protein
VKTFDEALKKVLPTTDIKSVDNFALFYGEDIRRDLMESKAIEDLMTVQIINFMYMINQGTDPITLVLEIIKSNFCLGVAVGIEMEKQDADKSFT